MAANIRIITRNGQRQPEGVDTTDPSYEHVDLTDPTHRHVKAMLDRGQWACDSVDHNEDTGCSNPTCFKHPGKK